jgi:cytochrome c2
MFNMMTWVKLSGAVIASLLVFLLGNWAATAIYETGAGHEEAAAAPAEAPASTTAAATATEPAPTTAATEPAAAVTAGYVPPAPSAPLADLLAAADLAAGEKVFAKCKACHKIDGKNGLGPHLDGVIGRETGTAEGFKYSDANLNAHVVWSSQTLFDYLADPKAYMPGNKMTFVGVPAEADRVNLIAWLLANGGGTEAPAADAPAAPAAEAPAAEAPAAEAPATEAPAADVPATEAPATEAPATEAPAADVPFADLLAAADLAAGEKVFAKCKACHKLDGKNGLGPHLDGVFGRVSGTVEGFKYSDANKAAGVTWTAEVLNDYLADPKAYMPGNKMTFVGLPVAADRVNLIAWLQANGG